MESSSSEWTMWCSEWTWGIESFQPRNAIQLAIQLALSLLALQWAVIVCLFQKSLSENTGLFIFMFVNEWHFHTQAA